jgi:ATP-dependent DNA helicase RecQ
MQLIAGAVIDDLQKQFKSENYDNALALLDHLCHFDLSGEGLEEKFSAAKQPFINVLINILQRGIPTTLNINALLALNSRTDLFEVRNEEHGIKVEWSDRAKSHADQLSLALHIVDSKLDKQSIIQNWHQNGYSLGSAAEEQFLFNSFNQIFGESGDIFIQLLTPQRTLTSILKDKLPVNLPDHVRKDFDGQRTDFSLEFAYAKPESYQGIVIEIDGQQHRDERQLYLDRQRDEALAKIKWHNTIRIPTENLKNGSYLHTLNTVFGNAVSNPFISTTIENYHKQLQKDSQFQEISDLSLIPFGVARIQRSVLELIKQGILNLDDPAWEIAVIERDIPCARLAIDDLKATIACLKKLAPEVIFPEINLIVFGTERSISSAFQFDANVNHINTFDLLTRYSCVLDVSILIRQGVYFPVKSQSAVYSIRSSHYSFEKIRIHTSRHVQYPQIAYKTIDEKWVIDEEKEEALSYFLQYLFRKIDFRAGQIPIINKALQAKSVIGLLPTGGGKSITYQLSALLQPGICLVIDPIRSLMKDQVDGLTDNHIDAAIFINSSLKGAEKQQAIKKLHGGQAQFVFISPERLQMDEFRDALQKMNDDKLFFSYCIIDEAHCVSEWGHDFRTAYLRLGVNAYKICKTADGTPVPLFGLTATASYDVLSDIQRELSGYGSYKLDDDSLVRFESTVRPEIQFMIEDVTIPSTTFNSIWTLKAQLGEAKRKRIFRILENLPDNFLTFLATPENLFTDDDWENKPEETQEKLERLLIPDFDPNNFFSPKNGGLIFCPHKSGHYGITDQFKPPRNGMPLPFSGIYDHVRNKPGIRAGFFMGSGDEQDDTAKLIVEQSIDNQTAFKKNELNLMVATKAFGMGIDKPNIRYTIHLTYPSSIESFVQEAGRCGRDRDLALSFLLLNNQTFTNLNTGDKIDHDLDINFYFHNNSFKGVSKEMAVLDELLTEIYFPDRTSEIENIIAAELGVEVTCNLWEGGVNKRIYINRAFRESYCYLDLNTLNGNTAGSIDAEVGNNIISLLVKYLRDLHLNTPVWEWIQTSESEVGIERRLDEMQKNKEFKIEIGFINNHVHRVKTLFTWLHAVIHGSFNLDLVKKLRQESNNADIFIEKVCEAYRGFTGIDLDFESVCTARDREKGNPAGYAYNYFCNLFNAYRTKQDTEKAIYRLSTLGIIEDYTVDFNSQTFTLHGRKKDETEYRKQLENYLQKFYSDKTARKKLSEADRLDEKTPIRKYLRFIIQFVYETIKAKRKTAIFEMKNACLEAIDKGDKSNLFLREYIDLYFNSKYARSGYIFLDAEGKEYDASITDLTEGGKKSDIQFVWDFIDYVDIDTSGTPLENTKHLRGGCIRMITNNPNNYSIRLLNAFTLLMLEYRNKRLVEEAINNIMMAFELMEEAEQMKEPTLKKHFDHYHSLITLKNDALDEIFKNMGFEFSFNSILISRSLKKLKIINGNLNNINNTIYRDVNQYH